MKGLLLKDAYQIWHYAKGVIVAAVVMMGAGVVTIMNGANFFIVYAGFLMGMMPMTLLAYDQASKFSEYSGVLPVTKEQLVGSKYIIGLCGLVLAELFAAAGERGQGQERGAGYQSCGQKQIECLNTLYHNRLFVRYSCRSGICCGRRRCGRSARPGNRPGKTARRG